MILSFIVRQIPNSLKKRLFKLVNRKSIRVRDLEVFKKHEECVTAIYGEALPLHKFLVTEKVLTFLTEAFNRSDCIDTRCSTFGPDYVASAYKKVVYEKLNLNHSYRDCSNWHDLIENFIKTHVQDIENGTRSPFMVVNVRAWESKPNAGDFGPSIWHSDGFSRGHLKLMVYLEGLGQDLGGLEIEGYDQIIGPPGLAVVFQNSDLTHRARPGNESSLRPVIEVTLMRSLLDPPRKKPYIGHDNDKHLRDPYIIYSSRNFDLQKNESMTSCNR